MNRSLQVMGKEKDEYDIEEKLLEWSNQVYRIVANNGKISLASAVRRIRNATANEIAMAIGWLIRDGKLEFRQTKQMWEVGMRDEKPKNNEG